MAKTSELEARATAAPIPDPCQAGECAGEVIGEVTEGRDSEVDEVDDFFVALDKLETAMIFLSYIASPTLVPEIKQFHREKAQELAAEIKEFNAQWGR